MKVSTESGPDPRDRHEFTNSDENLGAWACNSNTAWVLGTAPSAPGPQGMSPCGVAQFPGNELLVLQVAEDGVIAQYNCRQGPLSAFGEFGEHCPSCAFCAFCAWQSGMRAS